MKKQLKKHKETRINCIGAMNQDLIEYSWSINLNHSFKHTPKPFTRPRFKQTMGFIGTAYRCHKFLQKCKKLNLESHIDFFSPLKCKQIYGAPIGGIGAGSIGRTFTGDFCRFQLIPGMYEHAVAEVNMFTVCIRKGSSTVYQQALTTRSSKLKGLKDWKMSFPGNLGTYYALYPESWLVYNIPEHNVVLTCHQLSPIIPHNYKDSSLPVGMFNWTVENNNQEEIEVSLMLTWQSGSASNKFEVCDARSEAFEHTNYGASISGVILGQKLKGMPLEYCVSVRKTDGCVVTNCCQLYADSEESGSELWQELFKDGRLSNRKFKEDGGGKRLSIAVCATIKVKPLSKETVQFSLVWNMPNIYFTGDREKLFRRFYTRFFPFENMNSSEDIACYSLASQSEWSKAIKEWRDPILNNKQLPNFYKCCLFNELYFIADGGTVWIDIDTEDKNTSQNFTRDYGRFAYLEGHEYRMYNTYDVHFYASFALVKLWPKLQQSLQYDFADTICLQKDLSTKFLFKGENGIQKVKDCIPHDLGDPESQPWSHLNAYVLHDTKHWKDLNLKFILSVYRDYYHIKDLEFIKNMWPSIKRLLVTIQSQCGDDGLIHSEGFPDQTYDAWSVTGASAYVGGLHIATLKVVCEIAKLLGDEDTLRIYTEILLKACEAYDSKLWNGRYYKYDCSNSNYNDSIMTDMCCGHWFLRSSGLGYDVFDEKKIKSCLDTIFEFNVMKYGEGKRGAVNGMRPNGQVDITSIQSEEVWIGVTNALASLMVFEGMEEKAWKTIEGMYNLCYNELGLAFQTPEALLKSNTYRSLGYMRPLCVWSIQYAIDMKSGSEI